MPTLPPDTSLTFQDLILRVAEETRFAKYDDSNPNSPAQIPTDRGILDKIKRAINDGISLMARDYPKWTSLRPQVSFVMSTDGTGPLNLPNPITGEPDPSIYRLPWYITGRPINGWHWVSTASNFSGFAVDCDPERIDHLQRSTQTSSYPRVASIVPSISKGDTGADRQTKAVRFWPSPDQAYQVTARFLVHPSPMIELQDRHIFGASHDQTVLAYSVWCFKRNDAKDPGLRSEYRARVYGDGTTMNIGALAASIKIDQESVPASMGVMADPSINQSKSGRYVNPGLDVNTGSMTPVFA